MQESNGNKSLSAFAVSGAIILFIGTWLHPMSADPNDPLAAFTEYAANHLWVASHLMQLLGVALIIVALLLLSQQMSKGPAGSVAAIGAAGAIASLGLAGALQAVDGLALKVMVDRWASAPASSKEIVFNAAFAVRQIEIGLASIASIVSGLTFAIYGIAILQDGRYPRWLGILAMLGGVATTIAGVVIAYTGFSSLDMAMGMPANVLLLVFMIALGIYAWRVNFTTTQAK